MKFPVFLTAIILFSILQTKGYSQDLLITSGNISRNIKAGHYLEVMIRGKDVPGSPDKCPHSSVKGQLLSSINGVLRMVVKSEHAPLIQADSITGGVHSYYDVAGPVIEVDENAILGVRKLSRKKGRDTTFGENVGYTLILLSMGHLISIPFVENGDSKDTLLGVGLAEFGAGLIIALSSNRKILYTSSSCPGQDPSDRIWEIR